MGCITLCCRYCILCFATLSGFLCDLYGSVLWFIKVHHYGMLCSIWHNPYHSSDACERVAKKLRKDGATVFVYKCNLTNRDEVYSVAKKVEEEVGHVTILINNAGILISRTFLNCSDQELAKQVEINTISHFWVGSVFYRPAISQRQRITAVEKM